MADKKLDLSIISPGNKSDRQMPTTADMVILRLTSGDLGILPGRMPCSMVLGEGVLRILNDGSETRMNISGGVASVSQDVVTVMTESIEWLED